MAMQWPTRDDYLSAIQNPQNCFDDPELKSGVTAKDKFGLPFPSSGQFAVVFQLFVHTRSFGVRFFTSPVTDQQERYGKLGQHFAGFSHPALVRFSYLSQGIRVRGQKYPLVRMEWIPGEQLHSFV